MNDRANTGYCWVQRGIKGSPPAPRLSKKEKWKYKNGSFKAHYRDRQGHSLAVVGKTAYIFGGSSGNAYEHEGGERTTPVFYNDLFALRLNGQHASWERVKQSGKIPCPRDGQSMCAVGSLLYLFGGTDNPEGYECLEGLHRFDTESEKWEICHVHGFQPRTLGHSSATIDDAVYVFGGIYRGVATNSIIILNTDNLTWTPLLASGDPPSPRCDHGCAVVGERFYIMGGTGGENLWFNDMYCFDTATLQWRRILTESVPPHPRCFHTFTAHHQKDIYMFGGCNDSLEKKSVFSDLYKFNIASFKWKKPKASGTPPEKRFGHSACIIYGQLIIFGGMNNQKDFNDLCILQTRAANKYMSKDLAGLSTDTVLTSLGILETGEPDLNFNLEHPIPTSYRSLSPGRSMPSTTIDLGDFKQDVTAKFEELFDFIKIKFDQIEMEKEALKNAVEAFKEERKLHMDQYESQQKELQGMFERHKMQMEEWIKSERDQIDAEKHQLATERIQLVEEREKLYEEHKHLLQNSKPLDAIRKIGSIISEVGGTNDGD